MRAPAEADIYIPEFPRELRWVNVAFLRTPGLLGDSAPLIEFFDTARVNSLRTLPYLLEWDARYRRAGLRTVLVQAPGYSFGRDPAVAAEAIERLGIELPVALDLEFALWRLYGTPGWPARYLFDRSGLLRHVHFGEGAYEEFELGIQEVLREINPRAALPMPMEALRTEDEPGVLLEAQTADIALPADRDRLELVRDWLDGEDWIEAADAGAAATVRSFSAGAAYAVLSGGDLPSGLHECDGTVVAQSPGLRLHGFQFTPLPPA